jgi:hypothetical protein
MGLVLRLDPSYVVGGNSAQAKAAIVLKSQGRTGLRKRSILDINPLWTVDVGAEKGNERER